VRTAAPVTGDERRDAFARVAILDATRYPTSRFQIDSLVNVTRRADTLQGTAFGVFALRDVSTPMRATVRAWPEAGGLRVFAKFRVNAQDLVSVYGLSNFALGLGVSTNIWHHLFMGVDVVLRPEEG
jgi:hypothetical protein